ncbi:PhzF family phenazine biosynthesis protein [Catenuloplanes atrovinosus]|uniref:Trans-2,3-dihydro-3-hydroxyanthranilate isomerase n=1 Tax=Catenuloplanes atrovinosus TaxID=137266 RepID=A0AAE3YYT2_9ACTN|nr:PhzF family phenazine biosynthesis protein [Catenuloplanes atrovinosus]MDR7280581.1 trans-2,3-dihydro-3-hydroxyanthranilate isomerase [Catenuloplanes atrovinosus]
MTTVPYEIVDVFTDRPFAGNPLAVVFGAELLGTDQLQALAREFNLSETVFVLPPTPAAPDATYRARIFTPVAELPFAGHPSVGAAVTVARRGLASPGTLRQECGAGVLSIDVTSHGEGRLTGGTPTLGDERDPAPLLEVAGLTPADLAGPPPRPAGCGLEHLYLSVRPDAVSRARLDASAAARHDVPKLTILSWDDSTGIAHLRMFGSGVGVPEDPATGSAALGLGVYLVGAGLLPGDGESRYTIHQGAEIHRPSTLECTVTASAGTAVSATVAGHVVQVAKGEIAVPPFLG